MDQDRVTLLCHNEGVPIPRWQLAFAQPEYVGEYTLMEEYDQDAKRTVMMARLRTAGSDVLPPLRDARTLRHVRGIAIVTGVEVLDEVTGRRTAQTWHIRTAGYPGPGVDGDAMPVAK